VLARGVRRLWRMWLTGTANQWFAQPLPRLELCQMVGVLMVTWSRAKLGGAAVNREEAATLLGVDVDADLDEVRRAWRLWAKVAHPDAGGDPAHFAHLHHARQVLLRSAASAVPVNYTDSVMLHSRARIRGVIRWPDHPFLLVATAFAALGTAVVPHSLPPTVPLWLAAAPAALSSSAWAVLAARSLLVDHADRGHRISLLMVAWLPLVIGQLAVSSLLTTSLLPVLPLLALPIVAVVAWMNREAGFR